MRLAIFTSHPIQYQAPLFRELAGRSELDVHVFFGSRHGLDESRDREFGVDFRWDIPLLDGYRSEFLPNRARRPDVSSFMGVVVHEISDRWVSDDFDACLVLGWQTYGHLQAIRAALRSEIPVYLRGESQPVRSPPAGFRGRARQAAWSPIRSRLYTRLFRRIEGFFAIGSRNREYYLGFGVPDERIHFAPYCVDNRHFRLDGAERASARARVREELGLEKDAVLFGSVAKLIGKKRPLDALAAFARTAQSHGTAALVYVGDGPERRAVEAEAVRLGVDGRCKVAGFVNQAALPDWYAALDVLVLASDAGETWGLAVNEGMAAGLPVIVSKAAGCSADLVHEGENGFTFPLGEPEKLAERMIQLVEAGAEGRAALGARSQKIIDGFTVGRVADVIVTTLQGRVRTHDCE